MEKPIYLILMDKMFNAYRQKKNNDFIDALWEEVQHFEPTVVAKAIKTMYREEKFLPTIATFYDYCSAESQQSISRNLLPYDKTKPYVLTDLEMLWFSLNAKYCGYTITNRSKWDATERNQKVIEWSNGLIHEGNIADVRMGYEKYCQSFQVSEQVFDFKGLLDAIS